MYFVYFMLQMCFAIRTPTQRQENFLSEIISNFFLFRFPLKMKIKTYRLVWRIKTKDVNAIVHLYMHNIWIFEGMHFILGMLKKQMDFCLSIRASGTMVIDVLLNWSLIHPYLTFDFISKYHSSAPIYISCT